MSNNLILILKYSIQISSSSLNHSHRLHILFPESFRLFQNSFQILLSTVLSRSLEFLTQRFSLTSGKIKRFRQQNLHCNGTEMSVWCDALPKTNVPASDIKIKITQWHLTIDWIITWKNCCSRMRTTTLSDWLTVYMKNKKQTSNQFLKWVDTLRNTSRINVHSFG